MLLFSFNGLSSQAVIQILSSESEVKGMFINEKGFFNLDITTNNICILELVKVMFRKAKECRKTSRC